MFKKWSVELIYGLHDVINDEYDKKTVWDFSKAITKEKVFKASKNLSYHKGYGEHPLTAFTVLLNLINSGKINFETMLVFMFDQCIKGKGFWMKWDFRNHEDIIRFHSVFDGARQFEVLKKIHDEYEALPSAIKFSDTSKTLFKVDEEQKNKLYDLVKSNEISFLLYAQLLGKKFEVDTKKIKDRDFKRFMGIIKYIKEKQITEEKIKNIKER